MTTRPATVTSELQLRLLVPGTPSLPVRADLRYEPGDPYAVQVAFHTSAAGEVVEWTFARDLLSQGVHTPCGEGDVQVWPSSRVGDPVVCLSLSSPSGQALFEVPLRALADFLGRIYDAVPTGAEGEHVDVDGELALLLWAEPET